MNMEISIGDVASQMKLVKNLSLALQMFHQKTGLSGTFVFKYLPDQDTQSGGLQIDMGFEPREPSKVEYSMLFEEIVDAEKLLTNDYIINNVKNFSNIEQMLFKHKEESRQIIERKRAL